jgi:hypothetical protein
MLAHLLGSFQGCFFIYGDGGIRANIRAEIARNTQTGVSLFTDEVAFAVGCRRNPEDLLGALSHTQTAAFT